MNNKILLAVLPLALGVSVLVSRSAEASNYPPSYPTCSAVDTVQTGPFALIRDSVSLYHAHAQLTISYTGYLRNMYPDNEINFYVRLNGNDAFVAASAGTYNDAYVFLDSGPRDCVWCGNGGFNPYPQCDGLVFPQYSSGQWVCNEMSSTEAELFYWAFNQYGQQNDWDIEVAAESHGNWDSNWGNNFYGHFNALLSCY